MAIEQRRGCGYRKVGGIYLVSAGLAMSCCKMPIILHVCPTCNQGIKQSRGWQWIDPKPWVPGACSDALGIDLCPLANAERLGERVGLLWVGAKFYPTPTDFALEARHLGVSRRVKAVPRGFKVGETWVFLAHPHVRQQTNDVTGEGEWLPGIFKIFKPERVEKLITQTMSQDVEVMKDLEDKGITPVIVPDDDRDHQGSVYDDDLQDELPLGDQPHEEHRV